MQKKSITTILIAGNKIKATVAQRGNSNAFALLANVTTLHDGILNGEFLNEANFSLSLSACLSKAEAESHQSILEAYVGVPAEFCSFETAIHDVNLGTKKKVTPELLNSIFESTTANQQKKNYALISCSTVSCRLDDKTDVVSPVGHKAKSLKITLSYAFVRSSFLAFLNKCCKNYGLSAAIFVPMPVCEYVSLFSESQREQGVLYMNCNALSTCLVYGKGDGVVKLFSFPVGVAHIISDIQEVFPLPYEQAEQLVYSTVLTALPDESETIEVHGLSVSLKMVWDLVNYRVNSIAKQACATIDMFEENGIFVDNIYLTGDGIARVKGVKHHYEKRTNKTVAILAPSVPRFAKPQFASQYSLLKYSSRDSTK